jgi:hypothetical protein
MIKDPDFYTVTMARVYENQGYLEKAAEIYRHLLKLEPDRKDLAQALVGIEQKMDDAKNMKPADLVPLFREWIDLIFQYKRLKSLNRLKRRL